MSGDSEKTGWGLSRFIILGYAALGLLLLGLGVWGVTTRIAGAVVSSGIVAVQGNRQVVQHETGGVIAAINARDGDEVEAGEILVSLDGQKLRTELWIVEGQWYEILARKSRLSAERDGMDSIDFDPELVARAEVSPSAVRLMNAQIQQFEARRHLLEEETKQLRERQIQIDNQNDGLASLDAATNEQIDLITREIENQEELLSQGLTQITRVLTPQRELASLRGTAGRVGASIAENKGKIAEIEIELVRLQAQVREEAISELRDLEYREIELRERRRSLIEQINQLDLRAPVSGIVYGSTADTLRGVIRAAEPVMYIVPKDTTLIARTRIEPIHIDQIHIGQDAILRFSAFDSRSTPEVPGIISEVSADVIEDEQRGLRYYEADIELESDVFELLGDKQVVPGMPVEAYIQTGERSPLNYLLKPMTDYFNRAFREG
ncbi:HlyD family type I secretion periplasmic adaptor subunit [Amaricoccus macauensis]|uniref:HlyD family type I secretion periplasmic adaptor subunit n=1 Tax=Amaricoccus macauensis TaxID=57001 RepID=UPI003C79BABA